MPKRRRHDSWTARAVLLTTLVVFGLATTTTVRAQAAPTPTGEPVATTTLIPTATPPPTQDPAPTPTSAPTLAPIPTPTPAPTDTPPAVYCEWPSADAGYGQHIVRGETVRIPYSGFPPASAVALLFGPWEPDIADRVIGKGVADDDGAGVVAGTIPRDARIGETQLRVVADDCSTDVTIVVLGSRESMSIDDDTVVPGQRVTITAGGFVPQTRVHLTLDTHPTQGECWPDPCRVVGELRWTSETGTVVMHARIPEDVDAGTHWLFANGYTPDSSTYDLTVGVKFTVAPAGTLPPTDTAG